jgi:hypothetical protein
MEIDFSSLTCDEAGTRVVTRAKYCISFLRPFQGIVPAGGSDDEREFGSRHGG